MSSEWDRESCLSVGVRVCVLSPMLSTSLLYYWCPMAKRKAMATMKKQKKEEEEEAKVDWQLLLLSYALWHVTRMSSSPKTKFPKQDFLESRLSDHHQLFINFPEDKCKYYAWKISSLTACHHANKHKQTHTLSPLLNYRSIRCLMSECATVFAGGGALNGGPVIGTVAHTAANTKLRKVLKVLKVLLLKTPKNCSKLIWPLAGRRGGSGSKGGRKEGREGD